MLTVWKNKIKIKESQDFTAIGFEATFLVRDAPLKKVY